MGVALGPQMVDPDDRVKAMPQGFNPFIDELLGSSRLEIRAREGFNPGKVIVNVLDAGYVLGGDNGGRS